MRKISAPIATVAILLSATFVNPSLADSSGIPNENAIGYWTDARMKSAQPLELVVDSKTNIGFLQAKPSATTDPAPSPSSSSSNWDASKGKIQNMVGKVFFTFNATNYVCSGSLIEDGEAGFAIVLTAGHCVIDKGKFAKNWMFVPNYDYLITQNNGVIQTQDKWYATNLVVRSEFANSIQFNTGAIQHDWAFAVLKTTAFTKDGLPKAKHENALPDQSNTAFTLVIDGFSIKSNAWAFGYPAAKPYNGKNLVYAYGEVTTDPVTKNTTWGMPSPLTGGASGGPWLNFLSKDFNSGDVSSLNSYKYTGDLTRMYGPMFNSKTMETFNAAKANTCSASSTCISNFLVSSSLNTVTVTPVSAK